MHLKMVDPFLNLPRLFTLIINGILGHFLFGL